ncbi:MAG: hypothetical protein ACKVP4_14450 [Hyphomicrobium sp.]
MSPLIANVDLYFCAGYNADFFVNQSFAAPYDWQQPEEVAFYLGQAHRLVDSLGSCFDRARPFVPIGPNLHSKGAAYPVQQRLRNAHHKIASQFKRTLPWHFRWVDYEVRYRQLLKLREFPLNYDVVLLDNLWAWPRHRFALHRKLNELSHKFKIHSKLNWQELAEFDGGTTTTFCRSSFPLVNREIENYEEMLAASRLGIFATGLHWGWRNIMSLALMIGLPVYTDRIILEPWFDMGRFHIHQNASADWPDIEMQLQDITESKWESIKNKNQVVYDSVMAPEAVAEYFLETSTT